MSDITGLPPGEGSVLKELLSGCQSTNQSSRRTTALNNAATLELIEHIHSKIMEGECRIPVDAAVDTEARKQATHSSKFVPVLLGFTLCLAFAAAAVLVLDRHNKVGNNSWNSI